MRGETGRLVGQSWVSASKLPPPNPSIYWKLEVKSSQLTVVGLHRYQSERCGKTEADQLLQRNSREGGLTLTTPYAVPTSNADANNGYTLAHGTSCTAMTIRIDIAVQEHYLPEKDNSLNIDNDNNNTRLSGKKKRQKTKGTLACSSPAIVGKFQ